ncbi:hypothetical protein TraAM80_03795 [Trypanosoma rangeli]|uniref:Uncharacterized protein n=1 Tax=Trypanosoma rangeli TaxID=5698 RepID=A0A422NMX1_TRYRA|nr:uncharacterized protein TraAM80_03795 [Trypanosoma rangeli]RNF06850.1 hypothetical protein TraAM80_03795 [Trypanosoma rangeli]|eukprot:RNF06850.1 hypothetical protein TraAM80_03795 [Trypanosoma rangeli]
MLRVVSLGSLASDPRFFRQHTHGMMPYPVGYTIERGVFVRAGGDAPGERANVLFPGEQGANAHVADVYYTATIKKGPDGGPLFEVTRSDRPDVVHSGSNPSTPWRKALEAAEQDFAEDAGEIAKEKRDAQGGLTVRGQKWFGLTSDSVLARLKTLPGASIISEAGKRSSRRSSKGGKRSREGSLATATTTPVTEKSKKRPRTKSLVESSQQSVVQSDASASRKRRRATKETRQDDANNAAAVTVNDEDVPFSVSLAGRLRGVNAPCPECGLTTMFCPMTGQAHAVGASQGHSGGAAQGEALGRARRTSKRKEEPWAASAAAASNQAGRKQTHDADAVDGKKALTGKGSEGRGVSGLATRRKAAKSETPSASAAATPPGSQTKRQVQLKLQIRQNQAEACDPDDMPLALRLAKGIVTTSGAADSAAAVPPSLSILPLPPPPVWRPPLAAAESHKALQVLQRIIRAEKVIHAPFASLLQLPLMAAPKPRPVKNKSESATGAEQPGAGAENGADKGAELAAAKVENTNNSPEGRDRHPLDVTDVAFGVAGKRYVKFMQLYTSERTKLDLLRKADVIPPVPRTHATLKKQAVKSDEETIQSPAAAAAANGGGDEVKPEPKQN